MLALNEDTLPGQLSLEYVNGNLASRPGLLQSKSKNDSFQKCKVGLNFISITSFSRYKNNYIQYIQDLPLSQRPVLRPFPVNIITFTYIM